MYNTKNFFIKGYITRFISYIKVLDALDKPNDITNHTYNPTFVFKVVIH